MPDPNMLHTKACLAAAMIAAIENARDTDPLYDHTFRIWAQENRALEWADLYLVEGTEACTCPAPDPVDLLLSIRARQLELVRDTERLQRLIEA